jgi:hypothetical protein
VGAGEGASASRSRGPRLPRPSWDLLRTICARRASCSRDFILQEEGGRGWAGPGRRRAGPGRRRAGLGGLTWPLSTAPASPPPGLAVRTGAPPPTGGGDAGLDLGNPTGRIMGVGNSVGRRHRCPHPPALTLQQTRGQPRGARPPAALHPGIPCPGRALLLALCSQPPPAAFAPSSAAAFGLWGGEQVRPCQAVPSGPFPPPVPLTFLFLHLSQVISTHQGHTLGVALSLGQPHLQLKVLLPLPERQLLWGGRWPRHGGLAEAGPETWLVFSLGTPTLGTLPTLNTAYLGSTVLRRVCSGHSCKGPVGLLHVSR